MRPNETPIRPQCSEQFKNIAVELATYNAHLSNNNQLLADHIRRTNIAEERLKLVENQIIENNSKIKGAWQLISSILLISTLTLTILKILAII